MKKMKKPNLVSIEKCLKDNLSFEEYDAFFATIGYEKRSSYLAQTLPPKAKKCLLLDSIKVEY